MRGKQWMMDSAAALALAALIASCGSTGGGGGGNDGGGSQQFIRNSNNSGRLTLTVDPTEVDANKSDRIGMVAVLTDSTGRGIPGVPITFTTELDDVTFIPGEAPDETTGIAVTDSNGRADIIAVAGSTPTGTGAIVGTGAIFATAPQAFALRAQVQLTLYDVGFIDADALGVIPSADRPRQPDSGDRAFLHRDRRQSAVRADQSNQWHRHRELRAKVPAGLHRERRAPLHRQPLYRRW